jgi:hypothetical protein
MEELQNPEPEVPTLIEPEVVLHRIAVDVGDGEWYRTIPMFNSMEECVEAIRGNLMQAEGTAIASMLLPLEDGRFMVIPGSALQICILIAEECE